MRNLFFILFSILFLSCTGNLQKEPKEIKQDIFASNGTIPLIAIMVNDPDNEITFDEIEVYQDYYSSRYSYNVQGYIREVSHNNFNVSFQGIRGPYDITAETADTISDRIAEGLAQTHGDHFNFRVFDTNGNNIITEDELLVVAISNRSEYAAATRHVNTILHDEYGDLEFDMPASIHGARANLATIAHEVIHLLGAVDIYGSNCNSYGTTLMSCTINGTDGNDTVHLDPYHKIQLNWVEPRILKIERDFHKECYTLHTPQYEGYEIHNQQPVLIYNPEKIYNDLSEYFIVEFRNKNIDVEKLFSYEDGLNYPGYGVVIWTVKLDANGIPIQVPSSTKEHGIDGSIWNFGASRYENLFFSDYLGLDLRRNLIDPSNEPSSLTRKSKLWGPGEVDISYQNGTSANFKIVINDFNEYSRDVRICIENNTIL